MFNLFNHSFIRSEQINMKRKSKKIHDTEDLDFEEDFADDEEINLGIEDQEEAKEASARVYGRAARKAQFDAGEDSDEEPINPYSTDTGKVNYYSNFKNLYFFQKLAKTLCKFEKNEVYEDIEEENPYLSDMVNFIS